MSKKITSWSWSRYADYTLCPAKAKYKHILRIKEPGSAPMNRGAAIHDILAGYIRGELTKLPKTFTYEGADGTYRFGGEDFNEDFPDVSFVKKEIAKARSVYKKERTATAKTLTVEDDWAFTRDWRRTRWDDWTGCWVRMKLDLAYPVKKTLVILDWKSGRAREEEESNYLQQLELYALAGLLIYPQVEEVRPQLAFVDAGRVFPKVNGDLVISRDKLADLTRHWDALTKPMLSDTVFAPKANSKCRWCFYRKSNDGPCKF